MRIGILQFSARLGEVERNQTRADELLSKAGLFDRDRTPSDGSDSAHRVLGNGSETPPGHGQSVDLLVLPEMAFSGYNFPNLQAIRPFLEPTAAGPSAQWAARTARRLGCLVAVGYPETTTAPEQIPRHVNVEQPADSPSQARQAPPTASHGPAAQTFNFNSLVLVDSRGHVAAHYRKTHLYYTDATWAAPSPSGFTSASLPLPPPFTQQQQQLLPTPRAAVAPVYSSTAATTTTNTSFAICMDLNPQYFTAPWTAYEAASAARHAHASMLIASNAWISSKDASPSAPATEPDWDTLAYWLDRLRPLLEDAGRDHPPETASAGTDAMSHETLVVIANRTGIEPGPCRAFELDPAVRAAKKRARRERRGEDHRFAREMDTFLKEEQNEAALAAVSGTEPVAVQPPLPPDDDVGHSTDDDEDDEQGTVFLDEVCYAGSSTVLALGGGRARVWGVLGRAEEGVLVVNTRESAKHIWRLNRKEKEER